MFEGLTAEENDQRTRMVLEHELRAAIRIIGYFLEREGGCVDVPRTVLSTDYRVSVHTDSLSETISLATRVHGQAPGS